MQDYIRSLINRRKDETGASAVEYGLLVALIAAVIVVAVFALGGFVRDTFNDTCKAMDKDTAATSTATCGTKPAAP